MAEKPEDLNLPTSIVSKIIKDCLPANCKVSKEANAAIAKAASVFILYTTTTANGVASKSNRKTISGNDVISAMGEMEFDKFTKPLENSLSMWKKGQLEKKESAAAKKKAKDTKEKDPEAEKGSEGAAAEPEVVEIDDKDENEEKEEENN